MPEKSASFAGEFPEVGATETEDLEALDELFYRSARYRRTKEYKKFLDFIGRLPKYSPYNCALLHVQDPGVTYVATPRQWKSRFDRRVNPDVRPYVILQPFSPVMLVCDVSQTEPRSEESPELPKKVTDRKLPTHSKSKAACGKKPWIGSWRTAGRNEFRSARPRN